MSERALTSSRPHLIRAIYDWLLENDLTPYALVDARWPGVEVPPRVVKDGQVVLNLAPRAVAHLQLGRERITFLARFNGVSTAVSVPVAAVLALYARENGQGMMFPAEAPTPTAEADGAASTEGSGVAEGPAPSGGKPRPALRVVK